MSKLATFHSFNNLVPLCGFKKGLYKQPCIYIYIYTYMHLCVLCMYTCIYVCLHTCYDMHHHLERFCHRFQSCCLFLSTINICCLFLISISLIHISVDMNQHLHRHLGHIVVIFAFALAFSQHLLCLLVKPFIYYGYT